MPNKASAAKRVRQNIKRRIRNRATRSTMRSATKTALQAINSQDAPTVVPAVKKAQETVDRAAKHGAIHHRKAARITSRLMRKANKALAETKNT